MLVAPKEDNLETDCREIRDQIVRGAERYREALAQAAASGELPADFCAEESANVALIPALARLLLLECSEEPLGLPPELRNRTTLEQQRRIERLASRHRKLLKHKPRKSPGWLQRWLRPVGLDNQRRALLHMSRCGKLQAELYLVSTEIGLAVLSNETGITGQATAPA